MKNDISNHDVPLPDDERFMNAALEEHARLGSLPNDEALIDRILLETVNRKANTVAIASKNSTPWKSLAIGITSAAAGLTVGFFALQSFPLRDSVGQEEEVHFVVRILEDAPTPATAVTKAAPALVARPSESLIEPTYAQVDAVVGSTDASADYLLETQFGKSLAQLPAKAHRHNSFLISAENVLQASNATRFDGNVVIAHDTWRIEASAASVPIAGNVGGNAEDPSPSLSATNVVVTQANPLRTVYAKELIFDAVTGNLVLTGVQSLSASEGEMKKFQASDRLILTEMSYSIESIPTNTYASPKRVKPGRN
ncbi:hypothetical protein N9B73_08485 [Verrucomicrobiales bacterium]|jgi:hypothetical protein|nr:hypothetical protein [Verrucomicrobiales bacterium]